MPVEGTPCTQPGLVADLASLAPRFQAILLGEVGQAELLHRYDTKYVVPGSALPAVLQDAERHYRALEVQGLRVAPYQTVYYDTPELELYHAHYERCFPRAKVRVRTYQDTGRRYLETKLRGTPRWSGKERWTLDDVPRHLMMDPAAVPPLEETRGPVHLVPVVTVWYHRFTLVARDAVERVTVDVGVGMARDDETASYPGAAIIEVKQPGPGPSPMTDALASLSFRPRGLSKYCLGIAALGNGARTRRFQPLVHHLERLGSSHGDSVQR
jgi:hypothetical protein